MKVTSKYQKLIYQHDAITQTDYIIATSSLNFKLNEQQIVAHCCSISNQSKCIVNRLLNWCISECQAFSRHRNRGAIGRSVSDMHSRTDVFWAVDEWCEWRWWIWFRLAGCSRFWGVAMRKAREVVIVFVLGATSRTLSEERIDLVGTWSTTSSDRYVGWCCRRTLIVDKAILYSMCCLTCNQCRTRRRWVADERYGAWQTTRAKEFCTRCSRLILCSETPYGIALQ